MIEKIEVLQGQLMLVDSFMQGLIRGLQTISRRPPQLATVSRAYATR